MNANPFFELNLISESLKTIFFGLKHLLFDAEPGCKIRVADPDPYWILIQSGKWIRIQEGKNDPQK